jgi:ferredoxin--NADP+ reductase
VTGWLRRGPSGIIGTNRSDASEVIARLEEDAVAGTLLPHPTAGAGQPLEELLAQRGHPTVTWGGWSAIDAAEIALGQAQGRARVKIAVWEELLSAAGVDAP